MKEIFGDLLPDTQYIIGEPRKGNESGFYIIQKRISGKTWKKYSKRRTTEQNQEFMMQHRKQIIDLIGSARKVLVETGTSVDIWGDNIMIDEKGNIVFIDPGSPSDWERCHNDLIQLPKGARTLIAGVRGDKTKDLNRFPSVIGMSEEEIHAMNEKFGFTQEQYEQAYNRSLSRCEELSH